MDKLLSASEIAALKLPGVPTTRAAVNVMAKREGWEYETVTGIGGHRRVFRVPAKYLGGSQSQASAEQFDSAKIAGAVAGGSSQVDVRKLELAIRAVDEWERTRNATIAAERRPAVIAVLYEFLVRSNGQEDALDVVLRALG